VRKFHVLNASGLLASTAIFTGAALAQEAQPSQEIDEVVVTGIRASIRSSLEIKRDAIQAIDAISAEDIGDFPDKNVGEAVQRVPGVQITR